MSDIYEQSLRYHRKKPYGKLSILPTKSLEDRFDLSLAYSPGVAEPCRVIEKNPLEAAFLTAKGNLIAVISNGTAVLGLGDIGPLASKPVMEGKAVLFKKFAGLDAFDIEINEKDPDRLVDIIASLEPTFGGINLEDIKAPECFYIEEKLKERLHIPVFHDDQHGTAIIVGAALINGLELQGKTLQDIKVVVSGAGAAAIACLNVMVRLGVQKENIFVFDSKGFVSCERLSELDPYKAKFAQPLSSLSLDQAMETADVFLGLSKAGILSQEMVRKMPENPIILALANPEPEILPERVKEIRSDAIIATGRSDYPNQVNNVICYPYIFKGALDVGATCINEEMKIACVRAIASLAKAESCEHVRRAYGGEVHLFGPDYIIPKPFDPRLFRTLVYAVAQTAIETGVATRPIENLEAYGDDLHEFMHKSHILMRPLYSQAKLQKKMVRIVYAEGEELAVLEAVQSIIDQEMAKPILVGRPEVIKKRCDTLGLRMKIHDHFEVVDPGCDKRFTLYWQAYHKLMERKGVSPQDAKTRVRTNTTIIAALMCHLKDADAMICGTLGRYVDHFRSIVQIIERHAQIERYSTLCGVILSEGPLFFCDPYLQDNPCEEALIEMTLLACKQIEHFGLKPKVAFVSHSNFGTSRLSSAIKMQNAVSYLHNTHQNLEVDGEMHANLALDPLLRQKIFPQSKLKDRANLLVFPDIESANIAYNLMKVGHITLGPLLLGAQIPVHILTSSSQARDIVNLSAVCVAQFIENGL